MKRFAFIFALLITGITLFGVISYMTDTAHAQGRGDKRPAYQLLRDSTVTRILIDPEFLAQIVLKAASGNAALSDSAIKLRLGGLTSGHFVAASLDSILKLLVDSADVARSLRNGAITNRSPFASVSFDSLQNYWVLHSVAADSAYQSVYSDSSSYAGSAYSAEKYIGTDPIPEATHAATSDYATVAGSALAVLAYFTAAQWDSIRDSITVIAGALDTVAVATKALTVATGAVDSLGNFSAVIQDSHLVTKAIRQSLNTRVTNGAALSSTNEVVDSTGMWQTMVPKRTVGQPIRVGFGSGAATAKGDVMLDTSGTGNDIAIRLVSPLGEDTTVFKDSAAVVSMINAVSDGDSLDYIKMGSATAPSRITIASTPPASVDGNLWVDTTNLAVADTGKLKLYWDGAWNIIGGGGASGGAATDLSLGRFGGVVMDADSFLTRSRNDTTYEDLVLGTEAGDETKISRLVSTGLTQLDSLYSENASAVILIGDTITSAGTGANKLFIGRPSEGATTRPWVYTSNLNIGASGVESYTFTNSSFACSSMTARSDSSTTWGGLNPATGIVGDAVNAPLRIATHRLNVGDSIVVGGPLSGNNGTWTNGNGIVMIGKPISVTGANVSVINADVAVSGTGARFTNGGSSWGIDGLSMADGDSIGINNSGALKINSGAKIVVPSRGYATFHNPADDSTFYLLTSDEVNSVITTCPDPTASNPFITRGWMKYYTNEFLFPRIDSLLARRATNRFYKIPTCDDTLLFDPNVSQQFMWPRPFADVVFPWDSTSELIFPWTRPIGDPIGPFWGDSVGLYYNDPGDGFSEHIIKVSERFDSSSGNITGMYPTIKMACDSLPNIRVKILEAKDESDSTTTLSINPRNVSGGKQLRFYRGEALVADSIRKSLPTFLRKQGTYVKLYKAGDEETRWVLIETFQNDSTFTIRDSVLSGWFKANSTSVVDTLWEATFAIKTTIKVLPAVTGGMIVIPTTIVINDECPVRIEGIGRDEVILTNQRDNVTLCDQMFVTKKYSGYDTCYVGMPIEFADMTIYGDTLGADVDPLIQVSGNAKFENMGFAATSASPSRGVVFHDYYSGFYVKEQTPSLSFENVVVALAANNVFASVASDSTDFQSSHSIYSVSGDSGAVVTYLANVWPNAATQVPPSFFGDQFYFGTSTAKLARATVAQAWDSVSVAQSHFINVDGVSTDGSGVLGGDFNNIIPGGNNSYSAVMTHPPSKLKLLPVNPAYLPKK